MCNIFFHSCKDDIPLAVVLTFCSEGDNISDAVNLFLYLNDWLKMVPRREVCRHTQGIFGTCDLQSGDISGRLYNDA